MLLRDRVTVGLLAEGPSTTRDPRFACTHLAYLDESSRPPSPPQLGKTLVCGDFRWLGEPRAAFAPLFR